MSELNNIENLILEECANSELARDAGVYDGDYELYYEAPISLRPNLFNLRLLPEDVISKIDDSAKKKGVSRTAYLSNYLIENLG
jgi:hypothetical protein